MGEVDGFVREEVLHPLLCAYCEAGLHEHAERLLAMYPELSGCAASSAAFDVLLDALAHEPSHFRSVWGDMLTCSPVKPTASMLQRALEVAVSAQYLPWTLSVLEMLYAAQVEPTAESADAIWELSRGQSSSEDSKTLRAL